MKDTFGCLATLSNGDRKYRIARLGTLEKKLGSVSRLPYSLRILLENLLRNEDGVTVTDDDIQALVRWDAKATPNREIAFRPARVLMQDFTGVPAVVDLAAMRDAMKRLGGDPKNINPLFPAELVIDHSVQVDEFGSSTAFAFNTGREFERNRERYAFLRWGQRAFQNFKAVPPGTGIVHQVNLEYLARVVMVAEDGNGLPFAYPDTLVGTDSHTTMINGLGVLGWGVGGIEAEAAMLGQPVSMLIPQVVGFRLHGELPEGSTATDLVLRVTEMLRQKGVVGKFVEFYGPGLAHLPLADRATIANMAPEYGATCGIFPVDDASLDYLRLTGRPAEQVRLVEAYMKEQGLFHTPNTQHAEYSDSIELDLSTVEPSLAGPKRPQDRVRLSDVKRSFLDGLRTGPASSNVGTGVPLLVGCTTDAPSNRTATAVAEPATPERVGQGLPLPRGEGWGEGQNPGASGPNALTLTLSPRERGLPQQTESPTDAGGEQFTLQHGSVVIAAITSCTNTSNPSVMLAAGLVAKKAVERGLRTKPWVKSSLAPGSKVVTDYLKESGLMPYLEQLKFHLVGYGCTTCIGNSGPLPAAISRAIHDGNLTAAAVLSGNRNFEGRINPDVRANYLASPPLVVAYALTGRIDVDLSNEPIGTDKTGQPVYLKDIWPTQQEVSELIRRTVRSDMFRKSYSDVFTGDERWNSLPVPEGDTYAWDESSTYVKHPPYFVDMPLEPAAVTDITGARILAVLGDSITTDHISPAGSIKPNGPAGRYLQERGVSPADFNTYGARRGNHEVMMRGTFANARLRNRLVPGVEGGQTIHLPDSQQMSIYDAAMKYAEEKVPLLILAGKEYGSGSSRDWAAKGPYLLGVRAVIAESFERIHRSNLVGMGVLPLEFMPGESAESFGLTGHELFEIAGIAAGIATGFNPGRKLTVRACWTGGIRREFTVAARIDTPQEGQYYRHGGILHYVLRQLLREGGDAFTR